MRCTSANHYWWLQQHVSAFRVAFATLFIYTLTSKIFSSQIVLCHRLVRYHTHYIRYQLWSKDCVRPGHSLPQSKWKRILYLEEFVLDGVWFPKMTHQQITLDGTIQYVCSILGHSQYHSKKWNDSNKIDLKIDFGLTCLC